MTGKTNTKPPTQAQGSYTQMFLDNDNKHFIDAEKELSYNEVLSWGGHKHSEAIMPFLSDFSSTYPEIDYLYPPEFYGPPPSIVGDPDNPDWRSPDEIYEEAGYRFQCEIVCDPILRDCNDQKGIVCYYGAVTGDGIISRWSVTGDDTQEASNYYFENTDELEVTVYPIVDWLDLLPSGESQFYLELRYDDIGSSVDTMHYFPTLGKWIKILAGGSVCTDSIWVTCCGYVVDLAFDDDSTPDTIDPNDSITVYVTDGLAPFTWSTDSLGYSFTESETTDRSNTLECTAGVCDVDFSPYAEVTITDSCDNSVSAYIRNTDGVWSSLHYVCESNPCATASEAWCVDIDGILEYYCRYCIVAFDSGTSTCGVGNDVSCPGISYCNSYYGSVYDCTGEFAVVCRQQTYGPTPRLTDICLDATPPGEMLRIEAVGYFDWECP